MGKCLSCCDDDHRRRRRRHRPSTPNGHGPPASSTSSAHMHTSIATPAASQPATALLSPPPATTNTTTSSRSSSSSSSSSNKMLAATTKLLPSASHSADHGEVSEQRIHALFDEYRDPETDEIQVDGIERFCEDLQVKPEEFRILVLAWKFDAEQMCLFSRSEFVEGCKKLKVDSIAGLRACLPELVKQVHSSKEDFKQLYRWTYRFGLESGQRTLPTDVASVLWKLVFWQREPLLLQRWLDFLAAHPIRGIPRDTWDMLLVLLLDLKDDLTAYDDTEAWPSLFDDFVEYENDRHNQNIPNVSKDEKGDGND